MSLMVSFATQSVTRLRANRVEEWGQEVVDWENVDELEIDGCVAYGLASVEMESGRDITRSTVQLIAPFHADIKGGDRIKYDGNVYEIIGEPQAQRSPTGSVSNLEIMLKKWVGKQ